MRYIKLILSLFGFCAFTNIWAQLSTYEKPVSFGREAELRVSRRSANPSVTMPQLDNAKIARIEAARKERPELALFGYVHNVSYNLTNSGTWYNLSNVSVEAGGKLIMDGGKLTNAKLDFKPGSTLRIINNGIIETRNGFKAPVGAKVEISHGKIL